MPTMEDRAKWSSYSQRIYWVAVLAATWWVYAAGITLFAVELTLANDVCLEWGDVEAPGDVQDGFFAVTCERYRNGVEACKAFVNREQSTARCGVALVLIAVSVLFHVLSPLSYHAWTPAGGSANGTRHRDVNPVGVALFIAITTVFAAAVFDRALGHRFHPYVLPKAVLTVERLRINDEVAWCVRHGRDWE